MAKINEKKKKSGRDEDQQVSSCAAAPPGLPFHHPEHEVAESAAPAHHSLIPSFFILFHLSMPVWPAHSMRDVIARLYDAALLQKVRLTTGTTAPRSWVGQDGVPAGEFSVAPQLVTVAGSPAAGSISRAEALRSAMGRFANQILAVCLPASMSPSP